MSVYAYWFNEGEATTVVFDEHWHVFHNAYGEALRRARSTDELHFRSLEVKSHNVPLIALYVGGEPVALMAYRQRRREGETYTNFVGLEEPLSNAVLAEFVALAIQPLPDDLGEVQ